MAKIVIKSAKFGIVVKELDTTDYQDGADLFRDLLQAIPDADWFEASLDDDSSNQYSHPSGLSCPVSQQQHGY
jgi:predicted Zn-dependent protease